MSGDNTTTEPNPPENHKPPAKTLATPAPRKDKRKKPRLGLMLVLFFLMFIALGVVGVYFSWQLWTDYSTQQEPRLQVLETNAATQGVSLKRLSEQQNVQSNKQRSVLQGIRKDQQMLQQRLDSHTQRIRALAGTSRDDWLLAEARYLLRLASQRLLVERGTAGAQGLLQSADGILQSVDDAGVLPIREAIANEIIALKLAKTVDRQGIYLQLSALKSHIQQLPLVPFSPSAAAENTTTENKTRKDAKNDDEGQLWYHAVWASIKNAFSNFGQFVQIRHHEQAPELLVSERQQLHIINNLMLMLEQAQFALLHEEKDIYENSLLKALNWWDIYYPHYLEYEIIRSELNTLQSIKLTQELPTITRSSELLTDYIERFHRLNQAEETSQTSSISTHADNKERPQK